MSDNSHCSEILKHFIFPPYQGHCSSRRNHLTEEVRVGKINSFPRAVVDSLWCRYPWPVLCSLWCRYPGAIFCSVWCMYPGAVLCNLWCRYTGALLCSLYAGIQRLCCVPSVPICRGFLVFRLCRYTEAVLCSLSADVQGLCCVASVQI